MRQQVLVVLGILLILGCADEPQGKQYQSGCSEGSNSIPENEFVSPEAPSPEEELSPEDHHQRKDHHQKIMRSHGHYYRKGA